MKKITSLALMCMLCLSAVAQTLYAPHSLKATPNFNTVKLDWKAPGAKNALQWHNDYAYNGDDGVKADPNGPLQIYMGAKFDANDLENVAGEVIDSIGYYEYREMVNLTFFIYENGKEVYSEPLDVTGYIKDRWRKYALTTPYTIPANTEVMFALKMEYGDNMSMGAIKDDGAPTYFGKGDMYSYDGVNWSNSGYGNYLLTAYIKNDAEKATTAPEGYNVYCDGAKVNSALVEEETFTVTALADGSHTFEVAAVYGSNEGKSKSVKANTKAVTNSFPTPSFLSTSVEGFKAELNWNAPMLAPQELTWCNKEKSTSIGATSKTNPVVWIKNDLYPNDLVSYAGAKIKAINVHLSTAVTSVIMWVMKDGQFVYSEIAPRVLVSGITPGEWSRFELKKPVEIEQGATYSYGLYITHAAGLKPITIDTSESVGTKGSQFSTSSQSSSGLENTKPYWKTLADGDINGNWMMTAEVDAPLAPTYKIAGYDIYRNGEKIATNVATTTYNDEVTAPGTYTYGLVAKSDNGLESEMVTKDLKFALPVVYNAPNIQSYNFDNATGKMNMKWNMDIELAHYGTPTYMVGFDEEMAMMYGTRFTTAELAPFVGYQISKLQIVLAEKVGDFSVGVYTTKGVALSELNFKEDEIEPFAIYTVELETPVPITETSDFYIAYKVEAPAGTSPIILDEGPLVTNGAMISITDGAKWMKLGTLNSSYNNYNIVIGANATAIDGSTPALLSKSSTLKAKNLVKNVAPVMDVEVDVEAEERAMSTVSTKAVATPKAATPKAVKFEVYRNLELIKETTATEFSEVLPNYGGFQYNVKAIFDNGWESALSESVVVNYAIPQKTDAPFDLKGVYADNKLNLEWSAASEAKVLTYAVGDETTDVAYRMTGQTKAYIAVKFPLDTVAKYDGMELTHINFKIATNQLNSISAIVMHGTTIEYAQPISLDELQTGWNKVRLNKPIKVKKGVELSIGYVCSFSSGTAVFVADAGPASNPGCCDMISASAYSWKSMYNDSDISCNWRIEGVLQKADNNATIKDASVKAAEEGVTYNVYCNKALVAEGVAATEFAVVNPAEGKYVVTAVKDGVESAESNVVYFYPTGVEENFVDENAPVEFFNLEGIKVAQPENGVFIKKQGAKATKQVM